MPMTWGRLDRIDEDSHGIRWIHLRTIWRGGVTTRVRMVLGEKVLIARGIERVDVASLRQGELVEVSYHRDLKGVKEAETIYVRSEGDRLQQEPKHSQ